MKIKDASTMVFILNMLTTSTAGLVYMSRVTCYASRVTITAWDTFNFVYFFSFIDFPFMIKSFKTALPSITFTIIKHSLLVHLDFLSFLLLPCIFIYYLFKEFIFYYHQITYFFLFKQVKVPLAFLCKSW